MKFRRSLRSDIIIINSVVVAIILFMQFFYFAYLSDMMTKQKQNNVDGLVSQVNSEIEDCISISKAMQRFILSDTNVRDFVKSSDTAEREKYWSEFLRSVRDESSIYVDTLSVIVQDSEGELYYALNEPGQNEKDKILNLIPDTNENFDKDGTVFYNVDNSSYKKIYTCIYAPITLYNTKIVGMDIVGRIIVINRFNVREIAYENGFFSGIKIELIPTESINSAVADIDFMAGDNHISSERDIYTTSWKIRAEANEEIIKDDLGLNYQKSIVIAEIIIIAIAIFIMMLVLNKSIAKPAENILKFLNNYRLNGGGQRLNRFRASEFDSIALHINRMLIKNEKMTRDIVRNQQKLYEKEISENEAMLYALQSQINPHFLYNTLDCMASIAIANGQDDIYKITMGLADILRYSLVDDIDVTLEDEIAIIEKYLAIQQIRFRDRVEVDLDIDDEIWEVGMVRMSLQPIVENIFKYAMDKENTLITINGYREGNRVKISIRDNGKGMSDDDYKELMQRLAGESEMYSKKGKNGLVNINKRLKFKYGNEYGLTINQQESEFMEVVVVIPFNE